MTEQEQYETWAQSAKKYGRDCLPSAWEAWKARAELEKREYERIAHQKTFDLVFSVIDSWNDLVDGANFKAMIESFTAKMDPIIEEYFAAKFPAHTEMMRKKGLR